VKRYRLPLFVAWAGVIRRGARYDWSVDLSADFIIANGWFGTGRAFVKAILCQV
jgi:hypothetical protein